MKNKISKAMIKLNDVLPLKERQNKCDVKTRVLHQKILNSFVLTGCILSKAELAEYDDKFEQAIYELDNNELVIFSDNGNPVGAYPFTMEDRENKVTVNDFEVNAMCAFDALAVSSMYKLDTQINSHCRITGDPIYIMQSGTDILNADEAGNVYLCISWGAVKNNMKCADSLCTEIFFVKNKSIANTWLQIDEKNREVFTLKEAMEFSQQFFLPLVS